MRRILWLIDSNVGNASRLGRSIVDNVRLTGRLATCIDGMCWPNGMTDDLRFATASAVADAGILVIVISQSAPRDHWYGWCKRNRIELDSIGVDIEGIGQTMSVYTDGGQSISDIADSILWTLNICRMI